MNSRDAAARIKRLIVSAATLELQFHSLRLPRFEEANQNPALFVVRGHHTRGLDLIAKARTDLLRLATRNATSRDVQPYSFEDAENNLSQAARHLVTVAEAVKPRKE